MRWVAALGFCVAFGLLVWVGGAFGSAPLASLGDARAYAQHAAATQYGWRDSEWLALDAIIRPESGWNPCASYPGRHDCAYAGSNSCGIPQANPCPQAWRGRLGTTVKAQVDWTLAYVARRYGSPSRALWFRRGHGWY